MGGASSSSRTAAVSVSEAILAAPGRTGLEEHLPAFLERHRWFGGKARRVTGVRLRDAVPLDAARDAPMVVLVDVAYVGATPETYVLLLAVSRASPAGGGEVAILQLPDGPAVIHAAEGDPRAAHALLDAIAGGRRLRGQGGALVAGATPGTSVPAAPGDAPRAMLLAGDQSNTSVRLGDRMILKVFRRTEPGANPEAEVGAFLTTCTGFRGAPPALGVVEYLPDGGEAMAVAVLQGFVPNDGDAWGLMRRALEDHLEPAARSRQARPADPSLELARLLGRRTAELHLALASRADIPGFAPEPFTAASQVAMHEALARTARRSLGLLSMRAADPTPEVRAAATGSPDAAAAAMRRAAWLLGPPVHASRIRIHGDLHLGQVLWTGSDFVFTDFEGEPARPLAERRAKESALRDVAGMIRSFHYASRAGAMAVPDARSREGVGPALDAWYRAMAGAYLEAYLARAAGAPFLPPGPEERRRLLQIHLLEKALYEVAYELDHRPGWVGLPLAGLRELLRDPDAMPSEPAP